MTPSEREIAGENAFALKGFELAAPWWTIEPVEKSSPSGAAISLSKTF
jgi:hypothetical protein